MFFFSNEKIDRFQNPTSMIFHLSKGGRKLQYTWYLALTIESLRSTTRRHKFCIFNEQKKTFARLSRAFIITIHLLYGSVSQGLGTTKFTNLIGWNGYWPRSRFSHLDRQCFEVKKSQTKIQNHWLFSSNNMYFCKCQKADEKKKIKRTSKLWKN